MTRSSYRERPLPVTKHLRLVLQCRDANEVALCEHLAFAFARDAGLRGVDVWYVATVAAELAHHALCRSGGELEVRVVASPRPAVELRARDQGPALTTLPVGIGALRQCMSELFIGAEGEGTVVVARKWLP